MDGELVIGVCITLDRHVLMKVGKKGMTNNNNNIHLYMIHGQRHQKQTNITQHISL